MRDHDFCRMSEWYLVLGEFAPLTGFLKLDETELKLLQDGVGKGRETRAVVKRLKTVMRRGSFNNYFVSTDVCSPTDTPRFAAKRGAVHSAESAWYYLATSEKVRQAAAAGLVQYICVRPFVKLDRTREFRLFIKDRELRAMSQYHLERHFRRLEGIRNDLWQRALGWFEAVKNRLPVDDLVIDVYLDDDSKAPVFVVDVNCWGEPTDPLLLRSFDRDWSKTAGIVLMLPPAKLSGDVAVSF